MDTSMDIPNGFEVMPNNSGDNGNSGQEAFSMDKQNQFGNIDDVDLFLSLKCHIDSQQRLIQLYRTRIRSFEMFRKYCQRLAHFDSGGAGDSETIKFNLKQFQNEYNKFDLNYRYFRKRIRNLRKQTKPILSIQNQNVYDILYGLAAKLESNDNNRYISGDQIYPEVSINEVIESTELANYSIDRNDPVNNDGDLDNTLDNCDDYDNEDYFVEPHKQTAKVKSKKSSESTKTVAAAEKISQTKVKQEISTDSDSVTSVKENRRRPPNCDTRKMFACEVDGCQYSTNNSRHLIQHKRTHSNVRPFNCDKCDAAFKTKGELKQHQNIHEGRRFSCTFEGCTVNYAMKKDLTKHLKVFHTKEAPLLYCNWDGCDFATYTVPCLKIHRNVHTDERPFKCPDCEMAFKAPASLWGHKQIHQTERRFKCDFEGCDYASYSKKLLHRHQFVHNVDRPFKCEWPECGMSFKSPSSLICHKSMHEKQRRYKCDWEGCDYTTRRKECLKAHRSVHTGERPFKCPECEKTFKSGSNLRGHRLIHQTERCYKCDFEGCDYSSYSKKSFQSHQYLHTVDRPFNCDWPECAMLFKSPAGLWKHKKVHENQR